MRSARAIMFDFNGTLSHDETWLSNVEWETVSKCRP